MWYGYANFDLTLFCLDMVWFCNGISFQRDGMNSGVQFEVVAGCEQCVQGCLSEVDTSCRRGDEMC